MGMSAKKVDNPGPYKKRRRHRRSTPLDDKHADAVLRVQAVAPLIAIGLSQADACAIAGISVHHFFQSKYRIPDIYLDIIQNTTKIYHDETVKAMAWSDALNTLVSLSACEAMLSKVMADRDLGEAQSCEEKSVSVGAECPVCACLKLTSAAMESYKPIACTPASVVEHASSTAQERAGAPPRHKRPSCKGKIP